MSGRTLLSITVLILASCSNYDFTVNDQIVYTPKPLFSAYEIPDKALKACVSQAISDGKVSSAAQLQELNCSRAGITQLNGISIFSALHTVKFSNNNIADLAPLSALIALEALYLDSNNIVDLAPLSTLTQLQVLDLSHNSSLRCPRDNSVAAINIIRLPKHCKK